MTVVKASRGDETRRGFFHRAIRSPQRYADRLCIFASISSFRAFQFLFIELPSPHSRHQELWRREESEADVRVRALEIRARS